MPSWISAKSAVAVGKPSRSRASRRVSMNSALELKIATGVRVVGRDMSTVPFSLSLRRSLRDRAVAARPAGGSQNDVGTTGAACGEPLAERGVHLTAPRDVRSQHSSRRAFEHSASKGAEALSPVPGRNLSSFLHRKVVNSGGLLPKIGEYPWRVYVCLPPVPGDGPRPSPG